MAQLSLYTDTIGMRVVHNCLCIGSIFLKGQHTTVIHDRGETTIDCFLDILHGGGVIQMDADGNSIVMLIYQLILHIDYNAD